MTVMETVCVTGGGAGGCVCDGHTGDVGKGDASEVGGGEGGGNGGAEVEHCGIQSETLGWILVQPA